jgi:DNA polymerase-3 subunit epsilon
MSALQQFLSDDDTVVVTDTETTGIQARQHRVIEVAGMRISGDGSRSEFSELINPETTIPGRITRITGITTGMVFDRPTAQEVIPSFMDFLGDGVFVAHNIRFDWSFLNAELDRLGLPGMENRGLCTLKLARRLLPGLRSKSLGNLAKFYRIPGEGRHRAAKDVEITAKVLERFCEMAADEHDITDIHELMELQGRTYARVHAHAQHVVTIKRDRLPDLPRSPGVYYMLDGRKKVLYVGKAKDLSKRVASYFNAIEAHPPRIRQLIAKVRDVRWEEQPTELHALIEESQEIKRLDPSFNRAQKKYIPRPYLRLDSREPFPRLTVQVIMRNDGAEYYGPFRSRSQAASLLELIEASFPVRNCSPSEFERRRRCVRADIGRCGAPCTAEISEQAYEEVIDAVRRFLSGDIGEVTMQLEDSMLQAAESLDFEMAARYRDWIELLEKRLARGGAVAQEVAGPETIYFMRGSDIERPTLVVMAFGRVHLLAAPEDESGGDHLIRDAMHDLDHLDVTGSGITPVEADARRVLDHWLHVHQDRIVSVERRMDEPRPVFAERTTSMIEMYLKTTG